MTHQLKVQSHARHRMEQRGLSQMDVEHACLSAPRAVLQPNDRWRLDGQDESGEDLTVIASIEADVIIVTVY